MNKIKIFALTVLTVMMVALVSCAGGRQDATYKGYGTIEFKGDTVTWTYDDVHVSKGTYTGNAAKNGKVNITFNEHSGDGGKTFSDDMDIYKASVEDGVLTFEIDGYPFHWSIVK